MRPRLAYDSPLGFIHIPLISAAKNVVCLPVVFFSSLFNDEIRLHFSVAAVNIKCCWALVAYPSVVGTLYVCVAAVGGSPIFLTKRDHDGRVYTVIIWKIWK